MIIDSSQKDYYERSRLWSDYFAITGAEIKQVKQVASPASLDLLEVGCGNGRLTSQLASFCKSITGVDPDNLLISHAQERLLELAQANICLKEGQAEALPFAEAKFDLVLMPWMLHLVKDRSKALQEAHRVLKPGGSLLVFALLPDCDYDLIAHHFVPAHDKQIEPESYYKQPIQETFGNLNCENLPENNDDFSFLFPNCAIAHEAFVFAFNHWYNCKLSPWDRGKLRRIIQRFKYGNLIRLQTKGLLLRAVKTNN